jgi:hypothetical protein
MCVRCAALPCRGLGLTRGCVAVGIDSSGRQDNRRSCTCSREAHYLVASGVDHFYCPVAGPVARIQCTLALITSHVTPLLWATCISILHSLGGPKDLLSTAVASSDMETIMVELSETDANDGCTICC